MDGDAPDKPAASSVYVGSWKFRRRVIFGTLSFCGANVAYLTVAGTDTVLHQQIALALTGLAATVIGSYVFGAVWDDHSIRRNQ